MTRTYLKGETHSPFLYVGLFSCVWVSFHVCGSHFMCVGLFSCVWVSFHTGAGVWVSFHVYWSFFMCADLFSGACVGLFSCVWVSFYVCGPLVCQLHNPEVPFSSLHDL